MILARYLVFLLIFFALLSEILSVNLFVKDMETYRFIYENSPEFDQWDLSYKYSFLYYSLNVVGKSADFSFIQFFMVSSLSQLILLSFGLMFFMRMSQIHVFLTIIFIMLICNSVIYIEYLRQAYIITLLPIFYTLINKEYLASALLVVALGCLFHLSALLMFIPMMILGAPNLSRRVYILLGCLSFIFVHLVSVSLVLEAVGNIYLNYFELEQRYQITNQYKIFKFVYISGTMALIYLFYRDAFPDAKLLFFKFVALGLGLGIFNFLFFTFSSRLFLLIQIALLVYLIVTPSKLGQNKTTMLSASALFVANAPFLFL